MSFFVSVYSAFGKLQLATTATSTVVDLDLTDWESGIYMVRIEAEGQRAVVKKLVVVGL